MNVYINVEVKSRDLEGRMLLGMVAAERGHQVVLGHKSQVLSPILHDKSNRGIVHEKSLTPSLVRLRELKAYSHLGFICTSQDEESGLLDEDYGQFAKNRYSDETLKLSGTVFTWGEFDKNGLEQSYPQYKSRIDNSGSPRVDFWRREFDRYYSLDDTLGMKNYILIPANFGTILHNMRMWQVLRSSRKLGYFGRETDEFEMYERWAYNTRLVAKFVSMIRSVAKRYADRTVVVRPHPIESVQAWEGHLGAIDNVLISKQGSVGAWIRNSSAMIHNGCSTALEAAAQGKPVIAFRPIVSNFERPIPNAISSVALDEADVLAQLDAIFSDSEPKHQLQENQIEMLHGRFSNLSGRLAADRIVDRWEKYKILREGKANSTLVLALKATPHWGRQVFQANLRSMLHRMKLRDGVSDPKFPGVSSAELKRIQHGCVRTLDRFRNVKISRLNQHLVLIERK